MKEIITRLTPLIWRLLVWSDDGVADGAFGVALKRARDIALEGGEAVDYGAVLGLLVVRKVNEG